MSKRILIVDDDPDIRRIVTFALSDESSYVVHEASSGEAALLYISRQPINLLFTDIRMPGMNGLELVKHVHDLDPETSVIVFTIHPEDLTPKRASDLKIDCLLEKPLSPDQIRLAVDLLLEPANLLPKTEQTATQSAPPTPSGGVGTLMTDQQPHQSGSLHQRLSRIQKRHTEPVRQAPMAMRITAGRRGSTGRHYTEDQIDSMRGALKELALEPDVQCAVLADMSGIVLTHWSRRRDINVSLVASLAAGSSLAMTEISRSLGQKRPGHLAIYEGEDQSILMAHMDNLLLILAIGANASLGWARIAALRTCEEVLRISNAG